jgi:hypothetical protein
MSDSEMNSNAKGQANQGVNGAAVTSTPGGTDAGPVRHDPKHGTQASGPRGDNPSTAGPGPTAVSSNTPENKPGQLNPSAPEDSNTTPGTTSDK